MTLLLASCGGCAQTVEWVNQEDLSPGPTAFSDCGYTPTAAAGRGDLLGAAVPALDTVLGMQGAAGGNGMGVGAPTRAEAARQLMLLDEQAERHMLRQMRLDLSRREKERQKDGTRGCACAWVLHACSVGTWTCRVSVCSRGCPVHIACAGVCAALHGAEAMLWRQVRSLQLDKARRRNQVQVEER